MVNGEPFLDQIPATDQDHVDYSTIVSDHLFVAPGRLKMLTEITTLHWIQEHDSVHQTLLSYSTCHNEPDAETICETYGDNLEMSCFRILAANLVLSGLCEELCFERRLDSSVLRCMAGSCERLVRLHMMEAKVIFRQLDMQMPKDCIQYWSKHGVADTMQTDADTHVLLGFLV